MRAGAIAVVALLLVVPIVYVAMPWRPPTVSAPPYPGFVNNQPHSDEAITGVQLEPLPEHDGRGFVALALPEMQYWAVPRARLRHLAPRLQYDCPSHTRSYIADNRCGAVFASPRLLSWWFTGPPERPSLQGSLLFIGSSHMRLLWIATLQEMGAVGAQLSSKVKRYTLSCVSAVVGGKPREVCYHAAPALHSVNLGNIASAMGGDGSRGPAYIVLQRGAWDAINLNTPPAKVAQETTAVLLILRQAFPQSRVLFILPHFFACPTLASFIPCRSMARQAMYREAMLVAITNATLHGRDAAGWVDVLDPWALTYSVCGTCANCSSRFVDADGHHLQSNALGSLAVLTAGWASLPLNTGVEETHAMVGVFRVQTVAGAPTKVNVMPLVHSSAVARRFIADVARALVNRQEEELLVHDARYDSHLVACGGVNQTVGEQRGANATDGARPGRPTGAPRTQRAIVAAPEFPLLPL